VFQGGKGVGGVCEAWPSSSDKGPRTSQELPKRSNNGPVRGEKKRGEKEAIPTCKRKTRSYALGGERRKRRADLA